MQNDIINTREEQKDKAKSAIITLVIWGAILLFVFMYTVSQEVAKPKEVVTTMLVNFGDNRNGVGEEEPAPQEGSLASEPVITPEEPAVAEEVVKVEKVEVKPEPKKEEPKKEIVKEKTVLGKNKDVKAVKATETKDEKKAVETKKSTTTKNSGTTSNTNNKAKSTAATANSKSGSGDGKGNSAIGSFLEGRGKAKGGQGDGTGAGNAGDPLGGSGNGDSKIGIDRNLTHYIPGTMGRGGSQPEHSCSASGTITISYTVDKSGNVVSARRLSGVSDPCVVSTSTAWVKKYVKAEKASTSSSGSYKITF